MDTSAGHCSYSTAVEDATGNWALLYYCVLLTLSFVKRPVEADIQSRDFNLGSNHKPEYTSSPTHLGGRSLVPSRVANERVIKRSPVSLGLDDRFESSHRIAPRTWLSSPHNLILATHSYWPGMPGNSQDHDIPFGEPRTSLENLGIILHRGI